jgi:hypothetical protein
MDTYVYRVSAKHLFGWGWIADFAYRWDAESFIAHRAGRNVEYRIEAETAEQIASESATWHRAMAGSAKF